MSEQTTLAAKVNEILSNRDLRDAEMIAEIKAMLPAPTPATLADMPGPERDACRWLQADVLNHDTCYVIADPHVDDGSAIMVAPSGRLVWFPASWITPRPDLPRMEFPGDKKPEPVPSLPDGWRLADHPDHGRVIVTTENPDREGNVAFVHRDAYLHRQHAHDWCKPDELTYIDQEDEDVSTVKVGDVIESADDPRIAALPEGSVLFDCDGDTVTKERWGWTGLGHHPIPSEGDEFGPWKVLRIPKEAD